MIHLKKALVAEVQDVAIEWNAQHNKLRVFTRGENTLALFSNEGTYGLAPQVPAGQVIVRNSTTLPDIIGSLERQGIIKVITTHVDAVTYQAIAIAEVLID